MRRPAPLALSREDARTLARAALCVPTDERRAFVKRVLAACRPFGRELSSDTLATQIVSAWRIAGVVPPASSASARFMGRKAA